MDGQIIRLLKSAGGPRSTAELSKGCKSSTETVESCCNKLSEEGPVVKITDGMWCFNPKFGSGRGPTSFSRPRPASRPPPRPVLPHRVNSPNVMPPASPIRNTIPFRSNTAVPRPLTNPVFRPTPMMSSPVRPVSRAPSSNTNMFVHPSRSSDTQVSCSPTNRVTRCPPPPRPRMLQPFNTASLANDGTKEEAMNKLSRQEEEVLRVISGSNHPWTYDQLKKSGLRFSPRICEDLVSKDLLIKIAGTPPMFTIKPGARQNPLKRGRHETPQKHVPPGLPRQSGPTPPKLPKLSKISTMSLDAINKNPVSAIVELGQKLGLSPNFNINRTSGPSNRKKFHMRLTLGDRIFDSVSTNKKDAKVHVSELALRTLHAENASGIVQSQPAFVDTTVRKARDPQINTSQAPAISPTPIRSIQGSSFFDKVGRFSYDLYNKLAATVQVSFPGRKVISVFILEDKRGGACTWSPISLGTGNRTVNGASINFEGKTVNDCHAEIIARRGLRRFLWEQLAIVSGSKNNSYPFPAILVKAQDSEKYKVDENINIHLFISTAPCGDSAIFPIGEATASTNHGTTHNPIMENEKQGLMRSKMESGQGTIPVDKDEDPLTIDGIAMGHQRLKTMSCSDKVSRWNVLGLQGGFLTQYLEPLYMVSLTLGCLFHHGHLSRAVCCRYKNMNLPAPYRVNHPILGCVPGQESERELGKTTEMSMNWCLGDTNVEVLDGCRGRCGKGVISRLSRVEIFAVYKNFTGSDGKDYMKEKNKVVEYSEAKKAFFQNISDNNYGKWVSKPSF